MAQPEWYWLNGSAYCPACVESDTPPITPADALRGPNETARCSCCGSEVSVDHEQLLAAWGSNDIEIENEVHLYFTSVARELDDWPAVAEKARHVFNVMFKDEVEDGSAVDAVLAGIAAAADECAMRQVALRLGVSVYAVRIALETTPANQPHLFVSECEKAEKKALEKTPWVRYQS